MKQLAKKNTNASGKAVACNDSSETVQARQGLTIADNRPSAALRSYDPSGSLRVIQQRQDFEGALGARNLKATTSAGMPVNLRNNLEQLSGVALSDVRVHYNSSQPLAIGAQAYAQGNHIHLGQGQEKHLPHEAWHVVQQKQGRVQATAQWNGLAVNTDATLESEADLMGTKALHFSTSGSTPKHAPLPQSSGVVQGYFVYGRRQVKRWSDSVLDVVSRYISENYPEKLAAFNQIRQDQGRWINLAQWVCDNLDIRLNAILHPKRDSHTGLEELPGISKRKRRKLTSEEDRGNTEADDQHPVGTPGLPVNGMDVDHPTEHDENGRLPVMEEGKYNYIVAKQKTGVSDSTTKLATDKRKYNSVARFVNDKKSLHLDSALRNFYRKNAPVGYNTSLPTEEDSDEYSYLFDVRYERDFTFDLPQESLNERRLGVDYFRAPFSHKHTLRDKQEKRIKTSLKRETRNIKGLGSKQIYMSFHVKPGTSKNKLQIAGTVNSYENSNMLGSREGFGTLFQQMVKIGEHELMIWINRSSAGHRSRYNACAIVPNMVQYREILQALEAQEEMEIIGPEEDVQPEETFEASTREKVFGEHQYPLMQNYKESMLNNRRKLIEKLSRAINDKSDEYICAITADKIDGFLQYPCLVLEPLKKYGTDRGIPSQLVDQLKHDIVLTLHEQYGISFANRASFGFAYPTVGDVGVSVRIWPGLVPGEFFSKMILDTLGAAGLISTKQDHLHEDPDHTPRQGDEPLVMALKMAVIRAQKRFQNFKQGLNDVGDWVMNRVTSNVIKANTLIELLTEDPDNITYIMRGVRTLENLNEYDLLQAAAEEDALDTEAPQREKELTAKYSQRTMHRKIAGWQVVTEVICSSGMDAYRQALETIGETQKKSSRLYFETKKVNTEIQKSSNYLERLGSITRMQDPSYNFVDQNDLNTGNPYTWEHGKNLPSVHIYDITNTPVSKPFDLVKDSKPDVMVLFESLSKHFQFGMDKTTLGRLMVYVNETSEEETVSRLTNEFKKLKSTSLPLYFLNYMALQNELFGE